MLPERAADLPDALGDRVVSDDDIGPDGLHDCVTVEQAAKGMELLEKWGSEEGVKEEFGTKARGRWSAFGQ